ncbi:MAG: nucleoid-structuring protein H-NS, partial [Phycisphaeraceae bacterium JB051]
MSETKAPWVTYRPELQVLDCTIRDGGLMNNHKFDPELVKAVYQTCVDAGIDAMEIGYKGDKKLFSTDDFGPFKFSDEEEIRKIVGDNDTDLKLAVMADAEKCDYQKDILPKSDSVLDIIRVATYLHQIPIAVDMIHDAHEKGYEVYCNIMAVSTASEPELDQALEVIAQTPCSTVVVVDSFGALYREQIDYLVKKYQGF